MRGSYFHTFQNIHIYNVSKLISERKIEDIIVCASRKDIVWCMCASRSLQETCKVWCTQETHDKSRVRSLSKSVCETSLCGSNDGKIYGRRRNKEGELKIQ